MDSAYAKTQIETDCFGRMLIERRRRATLILWVKVHHQGVLIVLSCHNGIAELTLSGSNVDENSQILPVIFFFTCLWKQRKILTMYHSGLTELSSSSGFLLSMKESENTVLVFSRKTVTGKVRVKPLWAHSAASVWSPRLASAFWTQGITRFSVSPVATSWES